MPSFVLLNQNTTLAPNKGPYLALFLWNITEHLFTSIFPVYSSTVSTSFIKQQFLAYTNKSQSVTRRSHPLVLVKVAAIIVK